MHALPAERAMVRCSKPRAHVIGAASLLIAAAVASAQGASPLKPSHLQGQVVDSAGHPVASALVETDDPPRATLSDAKGFFRFAELPAGPITVRVRRDGFAGIEVYVRGGNMPISMQFQDTLCGVIAFWTGSRQ
jgi:hypothetical protein